MDIRALRPEDDRGTFRSGDPDLDRFFLKYAGQNQFRHHLGTTYLAVEGKRILGFVTVAAGHLESEELPAALGRRLPRYPLPVLRLARLAVEESSRGKGGGRELLGAACTLAIRMSTEFGCAGIVADAKPGAVAFYEKHGFIPLSAVSGTLHSPPRPTPMFLSIARILKARGG